MFSLRLFLALTASYFITFVYSGDTTNTQLYSTPTATPTGIRTATYAGCFSQTVPLIWHGPYIYQAMGNCQMICDDLQNLVLGLGNGTDCWCGDYLPPENSKVSDDQCNTPCAGYPQDTCGSANSIKVYLTGYTLNSVPFYNVSSAASSVSSRPALSASSNASGSSKKGGTSAVGIVVGVIVGVVVVGAIAGGALIYFRRRQRAEMEEFKAQNDVQSFVGVGKVDQGRPEMWAPDSRLNGDGARRASNGSIADNQDFSRRILQVRNPDGF